MIVGEDSHVLLIDDAGKIIHLLPTEVRTMGRQAKGVRLIRLDAGRRLVSVVAFEEDGEEQASSGSSNGNGPEIAEVSNVTEDVQTEDNGLTLKLKDSDSQITQHLLFQDSQTASATATLLEDENLSIFEKDSSDDVQKMIF